MNDGRTLFQGPDPQDLTFSNIICLSFMYLPRQIHVRNALSLIPDHCRNIQGDYYYYSRATPESRSARKQASRQTLSPHILGPIQRRPAKDFRLTASLWLSLPFIKTQREIPQENHIHVSSTWQNSYPVRYRNENHGHKFKHSQIIKPLTNRRQTNRKKSNKKETSCVCIKMWSPYFVYHFQIINQKIQWSRIFRNKRPPQNKRPPRNKCSSKTMIFKGGSTQNRWLLMDEFSRGGVHKTDGFWRVMFQGGGEYTKPMGVKNKIY